MTPLTTSDVAGTITRDAEKYFPASSPLPDLRPEIVAARSASPLGVAMERIFDRKDGRPSELESKRRTRVFMHVLSETGSAVLAQRASKVAPARALQLLDDQAVLAVLLAARAAA